MTDNSMRCRKYTVEDYEVIAPWYLERGWPVAPKSEHLSNTGFIVEDDEGPACVGFIYLTNSKLGLFEWIATRPGMGRKAITALDVLVAFSKEASRGLGIEKLVHLAQDKYVSIMQRRYGFQPAEPLVLMTWGES